MEPRRLMNYGERSSNYHRYEPCQDFRSPAEIFYEIMDGGYVDKYVYEDIDIREYIRRSRIARVVRVAIISEGEGKLKTKLCG